MSSFTVASTSVNFDAIDMAFADKGNALEEITATLVVSNAADWGALFSLRSWNVAVRPIPGGTTIYVDVGGGAGVGTLSIDNLDGHQAILTSLTSDFIEPGSLRRKAQATWIITG